MAERTVTISGASKTFSVTGWRIGWIIAPPAVTDAIRKVHDFLTVGAPAPLQEGVAVALESCRRASTAGSPRVSPGGATCCTARWQGGIPCDPPEGAYYILADYSALCRLDDTAFALWLSREVGVTPVPGSSFFCSGSRTTLVRFVFCKTEEILRQAAERLGKIS